jgi:hypothetical protein
MAIRTAAAAVAAFCIAVANATRSRSKSTMTCGQGVSLCGALTLETGFGSGFYQHKAPSVHGLWPETGQYGTSQCIKPKNSADPTRVYECYNNSGDSNQHQLEFETHEWQKHGSCAGSKNVDDFFEQICSLSKAPLEVMEAAKVKGGANFNTLTQALKDASYPVWQLDEENGQVLLSACAGTDSHWVLAAVADFQKKCGGSSPSPSPPSPPPAPPPSPSTKSCPHGKKGPRCSSDGDCKGLKGCVRCSHSGFCTDIPLDWMV